MFFSKPTHQTASSISGIRLTDILKLFFLESVLVVSNRILPKLNMRFKIKNSNQEVQGNCVKTIEQQRDRVEVEWFKLELTDPVKNIKEAADAIVILKKLLKHIKQVWRDNTN